MLNVFRLLGDMSHLASILTLLLKLRASKSAAGISLKTQELFMVVFLARYLDLFVHVISLYNSLMKLLYLGLTGTIIYTIRATLPIKATYDKSQDSFQHWRFAVLPCAIMGLVVHTWDTMSPKSYFVFHGFFNLLNLFWVFSECLEPLAIVPQLIVLQRYREVENLTGHYVFLLGAYRLLYILNWIYRAYHEVHYYHRPLLYFAALIQTLLYIDFFYYYGVSKYYGGRLSLPS